MKKSIAHTFIIVTLGIAIILVSTWLVFAVYERWFLFEQVATVTVRGDQVLFVETAQTATQKTRGLSGRDTVPREGLLFVYDPPQDTGIWMKEMKFAIDIVWIADGKIVHIVENAPPDDRAERDVYRAGRAVDYVLELEAGEVGRFGLQPGDSAIVEY